MVRLRGEAQPANISDENPMGWDGFEFVEFAHPDPRKLECPVRVDGLLERLPPPLERRNALSPRRR